MGGYAVFVWPAYGVGLVALSCLALCSWTRYRRALRSLAHWQSDGASRR
jgi:heme exporter protein CcmD